MSNRNPSVDGFIRKNKKWSDALTTLREIVLESPLEEVIKWRVPCYTLNGQIVLFIGCLKETCGLSFIKGVLMKDPKGILVKPGENTQAARIARFGSVEQIKKLAPVLKKYIQEAIAIEKAGLKPPMKAREELVIPDELQARFDQDTELETAFTSLTPGRQRAYVLYINAAKQSKTRVARIEKHAQRILDGKGLDD